MFLDMNVFLSILTVDDLIYMEENLLHLYLGKILICLLICFIVFLCSCTHSLKLYVGSL